MLNFNPPNYYTVFQQFFNVEYRVMTLQTFAKFVVFKVEQRQKDQKTIFYVQKRVLCVETFVFPSKVLGILY